MMMDDLLLIRPSQSLQLGDLTLPPDVSQIFVDHLCFLQEGMREAEHIVIDEPSVAAIANLEVHDLPGIGENIELARTPFERMWIEWPNAPRNEIHRTLGTDGWMPKRSGYLVDRIRDDAGVYAAWPAAQHSTADSILAYPQALVIDLSRAGDNPAPDTADLETMLAATREVGVNSLPRPGAEKELLANTARAARNREAIARLANVMAPHFPGFTTPFYEWLASLEGTPDETLGELIAKQIRGELMNDVRFLFAALLTLNTRNFFTLEDGPDFARASSSRAKHGKPPLLDHRVLKIRPSKVQGLRGVGETAARKRFHHCRGHLKRRRGPDGSIRLFWWSDHWRGDPNKGLTTKTYRL